MRNKDYRLEPFPKSRRFSIDAGRLGRGKHIVHALLEVDVTAARQLMRAYERQTGAKPSFTAFIIKCLGGAIESNPHLHAYLNWRKQLVIYEDININTMIEVEMDGRKVPIPHIIKAVNKRSYRELHSEIRGVQVKPLESREAHFMGWFLVLPWLLRRIFYWVVMKVPQWVREYSSPVLVTAVGMFVRGSGWGIPMPNFTLTVTLGGIAEKPGVVDGRIEVREYLNMTVSVDHDIVDGAPAARFVNELRELIESGYGLSELQKIS
jgi:pyruvate/2-oxoglutarate dehydrogenase complex dihydrolipoamide acyltransferase (E2) component